MSIKKQSIVTLAGLATVVAMSSAIAFEGSVEGTSAAAAAQATNSINKGLARGIKLAPCSYGEINPKGEQEIHINTVDGLNVPVIAYDTEDDSDMLELIAFTGRCGKPPVGEE